MARRPAGAAAVANDGQDNSWSSYYTRVVESRVAGDNLEQRVVRVGGSGRWLEVGRSAPR